MEDEIFGVDAPADACELVGHYTTAESLEPMATSGRFRLSRLSNLNDPREYKSRSFRVIVGTLDPTELDLIQATLNTARQNTRAGSFTLDSSEGGPRTLLRTDARAFARQTMWSHYAGRSTGACVVFRRPHLEVVLRRQYGDDAFWGRIDYKAGLEDGWDLVVAADEFRHLELDAFVRNHERHTVHDSLLVKNRDWKVEREWRAGVLGHDQTVDAFLPLTDSVWPIAGFVLGEDFPVANLPVARLFAETFRIRRGVRVARLVRGVIETTQSAHHLLAGGSTQIGSLRRSGARTSGIGGPRVSLRLADDP